MAYKTLLTVVRSSNDAGHQITAAAQLARQFDAHLDIICIGIDEVQMGYYFAGADSVLQETSVELAREKAESLLAQAETLVQGEGVRWSARGVVSQYGVLSEVIAQVARFADLVILPPPYGDSGDTQTEVILEAVLFAGIAPVLVVPNSGLSTEFPARAVVGWDGSSEALRAARAALPLLNLATQTHVTVVESEGRHRDGPEPGQNLCTMFDRQGITAVLDLVPRQKSRVSDVLLDHVAKQGADIMVIGAYGHSRFREAILGGATRELLERATVPLLLAH
ncbi:MAG: universal stress protein [Rhodobacteraceae bacterium]|nr:universal stress protein [Paracoccaceae bacterium]